MTDVRDYRLQSDFFINNRKNFEEKLGDNTVAFLFAGEEVAISPDSDADFCPDHNFYYLTGIAKPHQVLVIIKRGSVSERLYALPHNDYKERWTGKRLDFDAFTKISGISDVRSLDDFQDESLKLIKDAGIKIGIDGAAGSGEVRAFRDSLTPIRADSDIVDFKDVLIRLRMIKSPLEQEAMRIAAKATEEAISAVKPMMVPGASEYDIRNAFEYELRKRGCIRVAFTSIVSAGTNTFYLHHSEGEDSGEGIIRPNSQLQLDVGARCCEYCADISRVFFIGEPDEHKKELLDLIRNLRKEAFAFLKPGVTFQELNCHMRRITGRWLVNHGLLKENHSEAETGNYYWHNTGHHLGLDTHDVSFRDEPFLPGNCLAIEPGVYIKEWGIGFRIEDDVLITDNGCELLSSGDDSSEGIIIL